MYSKSTRSNSIRPEASEIGSGSAGSGMSTVSSISLKIRSEEAIADCRVLYCAESSRIGWKNFTRYCA